MPGVEVVPAPVKGVVGDVKVKVGAEVREGDILAVQSSTKTEFQIKAPKTGRVKSIVDKGASVEEGDTVVEIEV